MIKNKFGDTLLPMLGLGCMRLPVIDNNVDSEQLYEMVSYSLHNGLNYFDTGYDYHGGMSERELGCVLSHFGREEFLLADKFPGYDPYNWRKVEKIFEEQLERCRVEYFDFYLFHNVCELNIDAYLSPKYGIFDYLKLQKEKGRIRYLGFSVHGDSKTMKRFLEAYGEEMEFAQIQLNYLDYEFQDAKDKIRILDEYNIPIWVMEPLRGGKLVNIEKKYEERLRVLDPKIKNHEWAFRFLQSVPSVKLILSGMSNIRQLKENVVFFSKEADTLDKKEWDELINIARDMTSVGTVPCTGCRYCTEHCEAGLDIPKLIGYYNEHTFSGGGFIVPSAVASMKRNERPTACLGCKRCETVCPQNIKISEILENLLKKLDLKK